VVEPPASEAELWLRVVRLRGVALSALAESCGVVWRDPTRWKGQAGQLVERALGASSGSDGEPDFAGLGIECKTVPLDHRGRPAQSTWVTRVPLLDDQERWATSRVRRKLARVLWVSLLPDGTVGEARLWSPTAEEEARLKSDWEDLMELVVTGRLDEIHAGLGEVLQIRPKAATAQSRAPGLDADGHRADVLPLGFYLRASFTRSLLPRSLRDVAALPKLD
jgi:DNA mismatch repair protein MutH